MSSPPADPAASPGSRGLTERILSLPTPVILATAGVLFLCLAVPALLGDSCTYDEAINLASGVSYISRRDFRMNPEHPPLSKILEALPVVAAGVRWPVEQDSWRTAHAWDFAYHLLYQSGNPARRVLALARCSAVFWSLLLAFSVYAVARDFFGPKAALISLGVATLCPTLLAHGHLVTNDVCVATLMFLTAVSFRSLFLEGALRWGAYSGVLLGGALGSKISAVLLLPVLLIFGVRAVLAPPAPGAGPRERTRRIAATLLAPALAFATLWGLYGFRFAPSTDPAIDFPWKSVLERDGILPTLTALARSWKILPAGYLYGFGFIAEENASGHSAFALGSFSDRGWWWYFPVAFLVKTPLPTLVLMGWGIAGLLRRGAAAKAASDFLFPPLIIYGVMACGSGLNIGIRYLLPAYPLLFVLAAAIPFESGGPSAPRWPARTVAALLALTFLEVLSQAPHSIAFFNTASRLLGQRHDVLVDSNLDWGQDLYRLKAYLDAHGIRTVKLAYFGSGSPREAGLKHTVLPGVSSYAEYLRHEPEWKNTGEPKPGEVVAISATHYAGPYLQDHDTFRRRYGRLEPEAIIGHSILVYRVPPDGK